MNHDASSQCSAKKLKQGNAWPRLLAALALVMCFGVSCQSESSSASTTVAPAELGSAVEQEQAIAAAIREAEKRGWKQVEVSGARFVDDHWEIGIWRLPKVPGGHATVDVAPDGRIIAYHSGA